METKDMGQRQEMGGHLLRRELNVEDSICAQHTHYTHTIHTQHIDTHHTHTWKARVHWSNTHTEQRPMSLYPTAHLPLGIKLSSLTFWDPEVELLSEPRLKELLIFLRDPMGASAFPVRPSLTWESPMG